MLQETKNPSIIIYTHPDCGYSQAAKEELDQDNIAYTEIDVSKVPEALSELERLTGGERITPVIVEGDQITVGWGGLG